MIRQIAHIFLFIFICSSTLYPQVPKLRSVYFVSSNTGWAVGYFGVIVKTNNGGESWSLQESGTVESDLLSVYFIDHKTGFAVGWQWLDHDVILKTTNGGSDWERIGYINYLGLNSVQFIDQNVGWIVGDWGTVLKTTDIGESWTTQTSGTTSPLYSVHFVDDSTGWAVGWLGVILKTTNGGINWFFQTSGTSYTLTSVNFTNQNAGWIVGGSGTILRTIDGGENWKADSSGVTSTLRSIGFIDENTGWIVGDNGIILNTKDSGKNWSFQTSGTTDQLYSVHFEDHNLGWTVGGSFNDGLILHTSNEGIDWIEQIITGIDVEEGEINDIQTNYSLTQNYPNPFNPSTVIKYQIPELSFVTLKVYDLLGSEIATLVNEEKTIGSYEVEFNGVGLTSGIYFYRLRAGEYVESRKMLLLK